MQAAFLDRDGVLLQDEGPITRPDEVVLIESVPEALDELRAKGYLTIVVSNQAVVARGLACEEDVDTIHERIQELLRAAGAPTIDAFYYCPHHPNATVGRYRCQCACRKPRPGLVLQAAREWRIHASDSYLVGDRMTDILAGCRAGCTTVLVHSGRHKDPPIESVDGLPADIIPDYTFTDLLAAARWMPDHSR